MDNRIVLQVPMSNSLRRDAEEVAQDIGFSSLQEVIRLLVRKFARRELAVKFEEVEIVQLSKQAKIRLNKIHTDINKGKNLYKAKDVDDFLRQLRS